MGSGRNSTLYALALIPALFFGFIFGVVLLLAPGDDTDSTCGPGWGSATTHVNPEDVPEITVAGYDQEQLINASLIMQAGNAMGVDLRDQTIAIMTAMGESSLRVLDHGDDAGPDSRGLFQQRDNGAWGTYEDRRDPRISATNFFKELVKIDNRDTLEPTIAAHRVQRNADPYHYTQYWPAALEVVGRLSGAEGIARELPPNSQYYALGNVKEHTAMLANIVGPQFGINTVGGYRENARDPNGHPSGLALDFMTNDIPNGQETGGRLAQYLIDTADFWRVDYIIWWQQIWTADRADEGWRQMEDRGSHTANHYDHVHVNLKPGGFNLFDFSCEAMSGSVDGEWIQPAQGPVTSSYGMRTDPVTGSFTRLHAGTDFSGGPGDGGPIWAASTGTVIAVYTDSAGGWTIDVDHGWGIMTSYKHMWSDGILVSEGDYVLVGQQIGKVGSSGHSTGPHLHFEVHVGGEPVDPEVWYLEQHGITLQ